MKKFKNKSLKIAITELISIIICVILLLGSAYSYNLFSETKEEFNIEKTKIDYIIQAPSDRQIAEIRQLKFVDHITPYYYKSIDISLNNKTFSTNLYIIDNKEDLKYTVFSDNLLVGSSNKLGETSVYITTDLAQKAGLNKGDKIIFAVNEKTEERIVAGIFKSDKRKVEGSIIALVTDEIKGELLKNSSYSGAYIKSNNLAEANDYFNNKYKPEGNIRKRDEFDSDEAYDTYLKTLDEDDTTASTFSTSDYIKEVQKRNADKLQREEIVTIALLIVAFLVFFITLIVKTRKYTNNSIIIDIKNNFKIEQEVDMYRRYYLKNEFLIIVGIIAVIAIEHIFKWGAIISKKNIVVIFIAIVGMGIICMREVSNLKKRFLIKKEEVKRQNKESEKSEERV